MIKDNIISFDFDGTIDHHFGNGDKNPYLKQIRDYIKRLKRRGYEIYIITRRYGPENANIGLMNEHLKVWNTAKELGIPKENVIFTNRKWKFTFIDSIGACMHVDDDDREKYWIERHLPHVSMIWLGDKNWEKKMIEEIDKHDHIKVWISNEKNLVSLGVALFIILLLTMLVL